MAADRTDGASGDVAEQFLQRSLGGDAAVGDHDETINDHLDLTQEG